MSPQKRNSLQNCFRQKPIGRFDTNNLKNPKSLVALQLLQYAVLSKGKSTDPTER